MDSKDKSSRSGSKTNLNESTMPLLEDVEGTVQEKEKIELKEKASLGSSDVQEEKDDSKTEKQDGGDQDTAVVTEEPTSKGAKKKEKKEKKEKVKKEKPPRGPSVVQTMTVGLNLLDRDERHVNDHINLQFEDVLAEPDANHGFDALWRLTYVVFSGTKFWLYRLLAALIALPCALCWGVNFALLTLCHVWAVTPCLKVLEVNFYWVKRIWSGLIRTILDPLFESCGQLCSNVRIQRLDARDQQHLI